MYMSLRYVESFDFNKIKTQNTKAAKMKKKRPKFIKDKFVELSRDSARVVAKK